MDPQLRGMRQHSYSTDLPDELLKIVYTKLPIQDFFRLRLVCKEWNHAATDRAFLERTCTTPIAKPHFAVMHPRGEVHGLLYRDAVSQGWNWTRLPFEAHHRKIVEEKGLIHSFNTKARHHEVFNVHTRVRHVLPVLPAGAESDNCLIALRVDTNPKPNYAFQVVYTKSGVSTHIYDSNTNSWALKCSVNEPSECEEDEKHEFLASAECNGFLYLWSETERLYTFNVERDVWNTLDTPGDTDFYCLPEVLAPIGAWQGRLFYITEDNHKNCHSIVVTVWELVDHALKKKWTYLDDLRMPNELHHYVCNYDQCRHYDDQRRPASFCDEYLLLYSWDLRKGFAQRFIMCNLDAGLDAEKWEIVDAPLPLMSCKLIDPDPLGRIRYN